MDEKWFPGHMMKAYRRMKENIKLVDIIIELRDARAPLASSNTNLGKLTGNKKLLIVLNKEDLAEADLTGDWIKFFTSRGIEAFPVSSRDKKGIRPLFDFLLKLLNEKREFLLKKGRRDARLRIMVVGIPNVGKSSFINSMSKRGKVKVGKKPGLTRGEQWLNITDGLELLDTPGILPFSRKEDAYWKLVLIGSVDRDKIEPMDILGSFYSNFPFDPMWEGFSDLSDFLQKKGEFYNFFMTGGKIDLDKTAIHFLHEVETGRIKKYMTLERPC
jgi:ribosome biogenesis GTPase A